MSDRRGARRWWLPAALVCAGLALVVGTATSWSRPPRSSPHAFAAPAATTAPSHAAASTGVGQVPVRVRIPGLHVDATVVPVDTEGTQIGVPPDAAQLGWWSEGAEPLAAVGRTVLVGHVDTPANSPGALFHLDRMRPHDRVEVQTSGGRTVRYQVDSLAAVPRSTGFPASTISRTGPPALVLITCGGPIIGHPRHYADNIVVTARPD